MSAEIDTRQAQGLAAEVLGEAPAAPGGASATTAVGKSTPADWLLAAGSQVMLGIWAVLVIFPFLWMIITSLKSNREIQSDPFGWPAEYQWDNFSRAWNAARIGDYTINTLIVMAMSLTGTILLSAMAAYVLSRFEFPGNRVVYLLFTAGLMFPVFLGLVPLRFLMTDLHLYNTYHGLALVYIAYSLPFTIFFMSSFFRTLPGEVAEAGIVDGASQMQVFFQIMLPMAKPGLIAMGIFNFLGQWNQFLLPLVLMAEDKLLLSVGLNFLSIQQGYASDYGALFAALTITMVPTLLVYIVFQRRLESGLTAGALKG
jgi:N-acetylglucosamine transport system permease protein